MVCADCRYFYDIFEVVSNGPDDLHLCKKGELVHALSYSCEKWDSGKPIWSPYIKPPKKEKSGKPIQETLF